MEQKSPTPNRQGRANWDVNRLNRRASKSGFHPCNIWRHAPEEKVGKSVREDPGIKADPIFVYGTLMSGPVMEALLGRVPPLESALCFQNMRFNVVEQIFPAMIPKEVWEEHVEHDADGWREPVGAERSTLVVGLLCYGLKMHERRLLDAFADEEFILQRVKVILSEEEKEVDAVTYMWQEKYIDGLDWKGNDWAFGSFQESHLGEYVELCKEFRAEFLAGRMTDEELEEVTGRKLPNTGLF